MRRLAILLVLCLLLPLQALAAAGHPGCTHGDAGAPEHAHLHMLDIDGHQHGGTGSDQADGNACEQCGVCHLACCVPLPASHRTGVVPLTVTVPLHLSVRYVGCPPGRLQRPPIAAA